LLKGAHCEQGVMNKIIVFRPGALGDTLLAFPALAALRRVFPGAWLVAVGNAPALALGRAAGLVDEVLPFDDLCWADLFAEDGICSPAALGALDGVDLAVLWLRDSAGLAARNLRALGIASVLSAPGRPPAEARVPAAEYLLGTLEPIIGKAAILPASLSPLALAPEARAWAEGEWAWLGLAGTSVLVLHPGSGGQAKCWPPERFAALAGRFLAANWKTLVIEGPADGAAALRVLDALPAGGAQRVSGLALPQLAALLARSTLYVGNDSGVSHLSALLGVPTLALFGPTDPAIWAPRGQRARVVWAGAQATNGSESGGTQFPQAPAAVIGEATPAGVTSPMTALSVDLVFEAAQALLRSDL
jgi:ADP-heptose:LPS heptosyltransferase